MPTLVVMRARNARRTSFRRGLGALGLAGLALVTVATGSHAFVGPPAPPVPPLLPMAGVVVVIDPGHNGRNYAHPEIINKTIYAGNGVFKACNTTGTATNAGYSEAAYTWDVAQRTATVLRLRGAKVYLTRPDNNGVGPCTPDRAAFAARDARRRPALDPRGRVDSGRGARLPRDRLDPPDRGRVGDRQGARPGTGDALDVPGPDGHAVRQLRRGW